MGHSPGAGGATGAEQHVAGERVRSLGRSVDMLCMLLSLPCAKSATLPPQAWSAEKSKEAASPPPCCYLMPLTMDSLAGINLIHQLSIPLAINHSLH